MKIPEIRQNKKTAVLTAAFEPRNRVSFLRGSKTVCRTLFKIIYQFTVGKIFPSQAGKTFPK
jgi:hypothetical protein